MVKTCRLRKQPIATTCIPHPVFRILQTDTRNLQSAPWYPQPASRYLKPIPRTPKQSTRIPIPKTRCLHPDTGIPHPDTRIAIPTTRNPQPAPRYPQPTPRYPKRASSSSQPPDTGNPHPDTRNYLPDTRNAAPAPFFELARRNFWSQVMILQITACIKNPGQNIYTLRNKTWQCYLKSLWLIFELHLLNCCYHFSRKGCRSYTAPHDKKWNQPLDL